MKKTLTAVFLATLLIWGFYAYHFGATMSPDSHTYDKWSEVLITKGFNIIAYQKSVEFHVPPYLYMGFVGLVALVKVCVRQFWQQAIVMINVILGAFLAVILADLVYIFTKNKLAVWFTAIFYILNPEIIPWSHYVLSDSSYMVLNFLIFYLIAKSFLGVHKSVFKNWIIILLVLLLNCFYRPTGLVMVPPVLFAIYLKMRRKAMRWNVFFAYFVVLVLILMAIHAIIIRNASLWPFEFGKSYLKGCVVDSYQKGIVVYERLHTYHQAPVKLIDYIFITIDKFVSYFYFSDRTFSFKHNFINYLVFAPLYILFILGALGTAKRTSDTGKRSLIALCVIVITGYALCYALTLTDFDWRYRLPILPYILFVSGVGMSFLLETKQ